MTPIKLARTNDTLNEIWELCRGRQIANHGTDETIDRIVWLIDRSVEFSVFLDKKFA